MKVLLVNRKRHTWTEARLQHAVLGLLGLLLMAVVFTQLGIRHGRQLEREEAQKGACAP